MPALNDEMSVAHTDLPPEQQAIRAKCFHPTGTFVEFKKEEIEQSIPDRFEKIVRMYPERIAVKTQNYTLTYETLNKSANRVANAIFSRIGAGQKTVALLLDNDAPMIVTILAVLKAGKICVPFDTSYPLAWIQNVIRDTGANLVVTDNKNLALATESRPAGGDLVNIDQLDPKLSLENPGIPVAAGDLAYVLYSSGSTSQPKGIMHSHRDLLHAVKASGNPCRYSPADRFSLLAPISSGHGGMTIFSAMLYGAALYLWNFRHQGFADLARWLRTEEITIYLSSPTVFRNFAATLSDRYGFPNLRLIRVGSEPLKRTDAESYKKYFSPNCVLVHILASAEAMHVADYFIGKSTDIDEAIVPVGFPVEGKTILILDEHGRELGVNEIGEVAVRSEYLFPGYWRNAELTQSVLLPDPAGGSNRIYRTGDLGRMASDGCLTFLGRKDLRVKVRGYSVDLTEIETALLNYPSVKEAVVAAAGDDDKRLIAYIAAKPRQTLNIKELRNSVKAILPDHMMPAAFVALDALPVNPNGKVDRRSLPEPGNTRPDVSTLYVAPRTPMEEELARIWGEVLCVDRVGIHDNFFDLGGHSLAATRVVSRVIRSLGVDMRAQSLLQAATVADMAAAILQAKVKTIGQEDAASILSELEALTDEEAQGYLTKT